MAVNENIDIGSLIAGAIDRFYEQLDVERKWFEQKSNEAKVFTESLHRRYLKLCDDGLLDEARFHDDDEDAEDDGSGPSMGAFGDDDDENDAAAQFLKQAQQQPKARRQAKAQGAPKEVDQKDPQPQPYRRRVKTPNYRRGYKTGWKAAHSNHPANPPEQDPEYVRGYMDGHKVSGHAQSITTHYNNALQAHEAGDHDAAKAHVAQAEPHAQELAGHHYNDWIAKSGALKGENGAETFRQYMERLMKPTRNKVKAKSGVRVPLAGNRSAFVGAVHHVTQKINQNMEHPDEEKHPEHPVSFASQMGSMVANYANKERIREANRAPAGRGGEGAEDERQGPERVARVEDPEAAAENQQKIDAAKEEMARNAWHENDYKKHVDDHGNHPLAHHDSLESAKSAALSHWKDRLLRHIDLTTRPGGRYETPDTVATGQVDENGQPVTTKFDVAKALRDVVTHPAGAFSRKARVDAVKNQVGQSDERKWGYTGQRAHPLHILVSRLQRAEGWLHGQHDQFAHGGFMHNLSAGRKTKLDPKVVSPEAAVEESLDLFQTWLIDNVDINDEQMASIMGSLEEQAYARLRSVNED